MDETPYRLAYESSVRAIDDQARVLEELRSRAGTLFAAAAVVTSFLGGEALGRESSQIVFLSLTGGAIGCFIGSSLLTLLIVWPFRFGVSLSAREMMREIGDSNTSTIDAYRELATRLELNYEQNSDRIRPLFWFLRGAIIFLILEVAGWIFVLWRL